MCTSLQMENRECMVRDGLCVRITSLLEYESAAGHLGIDIGKTQALPFLLVPEAGNGMVIVSAYPAADDKGPTYKDLTVLSAVSLAAYLKN